MSNDNQPDDAIAFVRKLIEDELWHIEYHERNLPKARNKVTLAEELIERAEIDTDNQPEPKRNSEGEPQLETVEQYAIELLDDAKSSVEYHEDALMSAHRNLALAKIIVSRGNYTEINMDDARKAVVERGKKHGW